MSLCRQIGKESPVLLTANENTSEDFMLRFSGEMGSVLVCLDQEAVDALRDFLEQCEVRYLLKRSYEKEHYFRFGKCVLA